MIKKINNNAPLIILVSYLILPIFSILSLLLNYRLTLLNSYVYELTILFLTVIFTIIMMKNKTITKNGMIISLFLPMVSLINLLFFSALTNYISIPLIICFLISLCLLIKCGKSTKLKILFSILTILLLFFCSFFFFIFVLFGSIGSVKVIKKEVSPNKKLVAKIIDDDQGALGGNTLVNVYEKNNDINLTFFKFTKIPVTVYIGKWGEFNDMKIKWKDNKTLLINEKAYKVKLGL